MKWKYCVETALISSLLISPIGFAQPHGAKQLPAPEEEASSPRQAAPAPQEPDHQSASASHPWTWWDYLPTLPSLWASPSHPPAVSDPLPHMIRPVPSLDSDEPFQLVSPPEEAPPVPCPSPLPAVPSSSQALTTIAEFFGEFDLSGSVFSDVGSFMSNDDLEEEPTAEETPAQEAPSVPPAAVMPPFPSFGATNALGLFSIGSSGLLPLLFSIRSPKTTSKTSKEDATLLEEKKSRSRTWIALTEGSAPSLAQIKKQQPPTQSRGTKPNQGTKNPSEKRRGPTTKRRGQGR